MFVELNFRKSNWLLCGTYHPPAQNDQYFFNCNDKDLDTCSNHDVLLAEDFDAEDDEPCLSNFLYQHDLYNLVKVGTCVKNSSKPTSIDLFLTAKNTHFQNTVAVCSGLSNFHKLVLTVLETSLNKNKHCQILYRDYKNFNSEFFNEDLRRATSNFLGQGDFVKLRHLDKHFVKNSRKKGPAGKISVFFFLDTLKTTF